MALDRSKRLRSTNSIRSDLSASTGNLSAFERVGAEKKSRATDTDPFGEATSADVAITPVKQPPSLLSGHAFFESSSSPTSRPPSNPRLLFETMVSCFINATKSHLDHEVATSILLGVVDFLLYQDERVPSVFPATKGVNAIYTLERAMAITALDIIENTQAVKTNRLEHMLKKHSEILANFHIKDTLLGHQKRATESKASLINDGLPKYLMTSLTTSAEHLAKTFPDQGSRYNYHFLLSGLANLNPVKMIFATHLSASEKKRILDLFLQTKQALSPNNRMPILGR